MLRVGRSTRVRRALALMTLLVVVAGVAGSVTAVVDRTMLRPAPREAAVLTTLPPPYPYSFASKLDTEAALPHDADGIIMVTYPSGLHYNPVTVSQYALAHYDRWLALQAPADSVALVRDADWLVSDQASDGLWYYDFPNGSMPVPWVSGMAQGQAISVLVRAYALTSDEKYLESARQALATFDKPSGQGGINSTDGGYVWFEETMPPYSPHILNGMIFAMYGALDMARVLHDPHAQQLFDAGVRTVSDNIAKYDAGNWSYYNQADPPGYASRFYHGLHIQLLRELWLLTGKDVFRQYADRFAAYEASPPPEVK